MWQNYCWRMAQVQGEAGANRSGLNSGGYANRSRRNAAVRAPRKKRNPYMDSMAEGRVFELSVQF